jgi:dephospho-CoA kinase
VALTGNVASGKTRVAEIWREAGTPVVLADDLSRKAVEPGTEGLAAVVESFGEGVLSPDGTLDRGALRERVFRDAGERELLESILHPRIQALREAWMKQRVREGCLLVVAEIPLLFEVGLEDDYDTVVLVEAPEEERMRRLTRDRGLSEGEAQAIMEAQMPSHEKRGRAEYILDNGGTLDELKEAALALLKLLQARARFRQREGL